MRGQIECTRRHDAENDETSRLSWCPSEGGKSSETPLSSWRSPPLQHHHGHYIKASQRRISDSTVTHNMILM